MLSHARPGAQLPALQCTMVPAVALVGIMGESFCSWHGSCGPAALQAWIAHARRLPLVCMQVTCSLPEHCLSSVVFGALMVMQGLSCSSILEPSLLLCKLSTAKLLQPHHVHCAAGILAEVASWGREFWEDHFERKVAHVLGWHSAGECRAHWLNHCNPRVNNGAWSAEEEVQLKQLAKRYQERSVSTVFIHPWQDSLLVLCGSLLGGSVGLCWCTHRPALGSRRRCQCSAVRCQAFGLWEMGQCRLAQLVPARNANF